MRIMVATVVVVLVLGILISPIFPMIFGFILLLALWSSMDPAAGNPYRRRMIEGRGVRGYTQTRAFYKPVEEKEIKKGRESKTSVFIFFLGISLIIAGFIMFLL